ncbi:MAG: hypothetical protein HUU02_14705, partial [Bacteroidetes bacterium]|nr:hypothetical protein [Bacteroidota bacterium]
MTDAVITAVRLWMQSKRRMIAMAIGLAAVLVYEAARAYYRPYIYAHGINDFHIADTLGNSLGTVATAFFFVSLLGTTELKGLFFLRVSVISVTVYELGHPLLGKPV